MPIIHGHTIQRIHAIHDIIQHTYKDTVQHHTYTIQYHTRYNTHAILQALLYNTH